MNEQTLEFIRQAQQVQQTYMVIGFIMVAWMMTIPVWLIFIWREFAKLNENQMRHREFEVAKYANEKDKRNPFSNASAIPQR